MLSPLGHGGSGLLFAYALSALGLALGLYPARPARAALLRLLWLSLPTAVVAAIVWDFLGAAVSPRSRPGPRRFSA